MQFVIYRDNSSWFHWRLMSDDGNKLAVSADTFGVVRLGADAVEPWTPPR